MASIQQSMNAMLGSLAGSAMAGSYMYRQTDAFRAKQLDARADKLMDLEIGQTGEKTGKFYEEARDLQVEAARLDPTEKRLSRVSEIYGEREEEAISAAEQERKQAEAEEKALRRLQMRTEKRRGMIEGVWQRQDGLKRKGEPGWADNLTASMDTPGDRSRDRLKMATLTRDIKFKEKHKGETD